MSGQWEVYGLCPCGFRRRAPFGDLFHIHLEVCPSCGEDKDNWKLETGRWNDEGVRLFKPSTWNSGFWETK